MGWLEFLAEFVGHVAWPLAIVLIVWLLRRPLQKAIADISARVTQVQVEAGGVTVGVTLEAGAARQSLESATPLDPASLPAVTSDVIEGLTANVSSARDIVDTAFQSVARELSRLADSRAGREGIPLGADADTTASILALNGAIPQAVANAVTVIQRLHGRLAHVPDSALSEDMTREFVDLATSILVRLETSQGHG